MKDFFDSFAGFLVICFLIFFIPWIIAVICFYPSHKRQVEKDRIYYSQPEWKRRGFTSEQAMLDDWADWERRSKEWAGSLSHMGGGSLDPDMFFNDL